jgi:hypothetical protein
VFDSSSQKKKGTNTRQHGKKEVSATKERRQDQKPSSEQAEKPTPNHPPQQSREKKRKPSEKCNYCGKPNHKEDVCYKKKLESDQQLPDLDSNFEADVDTHGDSTSSNSPGLILLDNGAQISVSGDATMLEYT